jgi:putative membrane protein insertion efficiency factor
MSHYYYKLIITVSAILILTTSIQCYATDEIQWAPWDFSNPSQKDAVGNRRKEDYSLFGVLLIDAVKGYQKYISSMKAGECPMHPSCSAYSIEAIKKHGAIIGFIMTVDRLIHESNEMDHAPIILKGGNIVKFSDSVENNDFWWYEK